MVKSIPERPSRPRQCLQRGTCVRAVSALALMFIGATGARAQDFESDRFTFRGFGTVGLTTHDAEGIEFRRNVGQGYGSEANEVDFHADSLAGLQLNTRIAPRFDLAL